MEKFQLGAPILFLVFNRFDFPTVKSFADKAVLKMLKSLEKKKQKTN